jgi:hypothetical protein
LCVFFPLHPIRRNSAEKGSQKNAKWVAVNWMDRESPSFPPVLKLSEFWPNRVEESDPPTAPTK